MAEVNKVRSAHLLRLDRCGINSPSCRCSANIPEFLFVVKFLNPRSVLDLVMVVLFCFYVEGGS
jgi:hypothetical protein